MKDCRSYTSPIVSAAAAAAACKHDHHQQQQHACMIIIIIISSSSSSSSIVVKQNTSENSKTVSTGDDLTADQRLLEHGERRRTAEHNCELRGFQTCSVFQQQKEVQCLGLRANVERSDQCGRVLDIKAPLDGCKYFAQRSHSYQRRSATVSASG